MWALLRRSRVVRWCRRVPASGSHRILSILTGQVCQCGRWLLFFHEYGRRVGMVPRSSLKEGKNRQMVEKGTKTPNQPKPNTPARRPKLHHLVVFPLHWVKRVKRRLVAINGPEFSREKDGSANCVHGKPPRRLQTDFPCQLLVTSGHTTVWQNKVTLQVSCIMWRSRRFTWCKPWASSFNREMQRKPLPSFSRSALLLLPKKCTHYSEGTHTTNGLQSTTLPWQYRPLIASM